MRKLMMVGALVGGMMLAGSGIAWPAAEEAITSTRAKTAVKKTKTAEPDASAPSDTRILRKLDQVLENQEAILAKFQDLDRRFDAVMEELRIVKVRASQSKGTVVVP